MGGSCLPFESNLPLVCERGEEYHCLLFKKHALNFAFIIALMHSWQSSRWKPLDGFENYIWSIFLILFKNKTLDKLRHESLRQPLATC